MRGAGATGEDWTARLGYDPRPELTHWKGTPIPPLDDPLAVSPRRREIAERVWEFCVSGSVVEWSPAGTKRIVSRVLPSGRSCRSA